MPDLPPDSRPTVRVACFGLGLMGAGMARRILGAGFPLAVWNRNPAKSAPFAPGGARVCTTPAEAAREADVLISMVADVEASRAVWLGARGALAALRPGAVCVESSTLTVEWIQELATAAGRAGGALLDASVTGSKTQAAEGQLLFMTGGEAAALERARPVLAAMSRGIVHLGPSGCGAWQKLINNFLGAVHIASLAEAVALIERSGVDRAKSLEMLTAGSPGSPIVKLISARMAASDYTPHFALELLDKDVRYALAEGARLGVELSTAQAARRRLREAIEQGYGARDMSAVIEPLRLQGQSAPA
jgi:3-hydroxyisobutyrate dehydrogenase